MKITTSSGTAFDLSPPDPNFERLQKVFSRQGEPDRIPFIELFADAEVMAAFLGETVQGAFPRDEGVREDSLRRVIRFWYEAGYDYVTMTAHVVIPRSLLQSEDTATLSREKRSWVNESRGIINSWEDFEKYPWPAPESVDYSALEFVSKNLPEGMKIIYMGPGGHIENIMWLMGYTPFALALKDDPALVGAVSEKVGALLLNLYSSAVQIPNVEAVWLGDDMGFKTSTMISPEDLRKYIFPWQKKLVDVAHAQGKPFLLHSCGNLRTIMDDLIEDVGIDAKHSFEDVIMPVTEAKQLYGDRIALLGGIDVGFLCNASQEEVRAYTRRVIDECGPGGGWALGTGNSVANYIPLDNYLAMLDEGRKYGVYGS